MVIEPEKSIINASIIAELILKHSQSFTKVQSVMVLMNKCYGVTE